MGTKSEGDTDASTEVEGEGVTRLPWRFVFRSLNGGPAEDSIQTVELSIGRSRCYGRGFVVGEVKSGARQRWPARRSGVQS